MLFPRSARETVTAAGGIPAEDSRPTPRATSPWLRGSLREPAMGSIGSRKTKEMDIEGSHVQEFVAFLILVTAGVASARCITRRVRGYRNSRRKKDGASDATGSSDSGCDLEAGANGAIEEMGSDIGSAAGFDLVLLFSKEGVNPGRRSSDVESGGGSVENASSWSKEKEGEVGQQREKSNERSRSTLTMNPSSAGDISLLSSQPTDIDDSSASVSNSADSGCSTWAADETCLRRDNDHTNDSALGSTAASEAMEVEFMVSDSSAARIGVKGAALSLRTLSSTMSDQSVVAYSSSESYLGQSSSGKSRSTGSDGDVESADPENNISGVGGSSTCDGSGMDGFNSSASDEVLMVDLHGLETLEEIDLTGGGMNGGVSGVCPGSSSEVDSLSTIDDSVLAKWRTKDLVDILRDGPTIEMCLRDIHLARCCDLDLSVSDTNADLTREKVIGAGCYGRVSRVRHGSSGATLAMKELTEGASQDYRDAAHNEMSVFLCLGSHPNILKVLALNSALPTMPILMELGLCDMVNVIESTNVSMPHKLGILCDAACGLKHMHEMGKVHRDIKAGNIIVTVDKKDGSATGKIADFGLTCNAGETTLTRTGTPGYIPVELLWDAAEAGAESDVFAFAVLMLEVLVLPELWENSMFAHSALVTAEEEQKFLSLAEDDTKGHIDLQFEVQQRTLDDGSFAMEILKPSNLQSSVPYREGVCGWLKACLCQPRDRRPSMETMVDVIQCSKEGREPPPMDMLHQVQSSKTGTKMRQSKSEGNVFRGVRRTPLRASPVARCHSSHVVCSPLQEQLLL